MLIEVPKFFGLTLHHATTKHAQLIGMLEETHASLNEALTIETSERKSLWHKYVNIANPSYVLQYVLQRRQWVWT